MSYEGYEQLLCAQGHAWNEGTWTRNSYDNSFKCTICKSPAVWVNSVDETNGCDKFDPHTEDCMCGHVILEVLEEAKFCACEKCGNRHVIEAERYKIPDDKGRKVVSPVEGD